LFFSQHKGRRVMVTSEARFKTTEIALRFFFRVRELLHGGKAHRLRARELPVVAEFTACSAMDDYRSIGWCMRGLDEIQLWLLSELYGPTSFGVRRRTYAQAYRAGRIEFPEFGIGLRRIASAHERAIESVSGRLRQLKMIPSDAAPGEPRARRRVRIQERRVVPQAAQLSP
jgi:hypothetical protein